MKGAVRLVEVFSSIQGEVERRVPGEVLSYEVEYLS